MFRLFDKTNSREEQEQLIFELSDSIQVTLHLENAPFYSRLYLLKDGKELTNASISYEDTQKIMAYHNQSRNMKQNNERLLQELNQLGLGNFNRVLIEQSTAISENSNRCS